jgi:two-component system, OmpR family, phosphate regulon sensor histidine kinase PhoR
LVSQAIEHLKQQPLFTKKQMRIRLQKPREKLPLLQADAAQLSILCDNLLSNALKYGADASQITVQLRLVADHIQLAVRDEGEGIAADHLPRLTERFYRVDTARSRIQGGSGLGLSIVKYIVERHHGVLTITSEEGIGSCFLVELPVLQA